MGNGGYDLDQEIEGLAGSVQRLKQATDPTANRHAASVLQAAE